MRIIAIAGMVLVCMEVVIVYSGAAIIFLFSPCYILYLLVGIEVIPSQIVIGRTCFEACLKRHVGFILQIDDFAGDTIYDFRGRAIDSSSVKVADGTC